MEQLHNGFTLQLSENGFPLSTDSIALAGFTKLPKNARVLDLGSGCGTLGLLLCAKDSSCAVTGVELQETDHLAALDNARRNKIPSRLTSICADILSIPSFLAPGSFDCCVSNPPYFSGGFKSQKTPLARSSDSCAPQALFEAASWALKFGGDFFLCHKVQYLAHLCSCAANVGLEAKKMLLVKNTPSSKADLVLIQFRKGAKPGLILEEAVLHTQSGDPTDYYRQLYHL
jgi:tRNA1(Val) A37 N6-methylase TrmN6